MRVLSQRRAVRPEGVGQGFEGPLPAVVGTTAKAEPGVEGSASYQYTWVGSTLGLRGPGVLGTGYWHSGING